MQLLALLNIRVCVLISQHKKATFNCIIFYFFVKASVSVKRLRDFLQSDELDLESTDRRDEPAGG